MQQRNGLNSNIKEIKSIQFGLLSPQDIENMSVIEIDNPQSFDDNGMPSEGGINDQRMGVISRTSRCKTCNCDCDKCPGHCGFISLVKPVFLVFFIRECLQLLSIICINCSRLLIKDEDYNRILEIRNKKQRKKEIYNLIKSNKLHRTCQNCQNVQNNYRKDGLKIYERINNTELKPERIYRIFERISDEDCQFLGFDPRFARPEWMIIKNLLVCPPSSRPSVSVDLSLRAQDDLTNQYNEILKINQKLEEQLNRHASEAIIKDLFDKLQFSIATLMKNNLSIGKALKKNGEPIKCLFSRINGKEGIIRGNIMGKRVDYSARSVISPDPNLQIDEIGIPLSIAMNLTFQEHFLDLGNQKEKLQRLIKNGPSRYPGAKYVITEKGKILCNYFKRELKIGDIVERHLLDGDIIIFNRQPSLHKMSMMGFKVKILPYSTFRLNLSVTTPFNADFDGDEMNLHLPQSIPVKKEVKDIMYVSKQVISPQSNRPIMGIVQDSLVGCSLFTSRDTFLTYEETMNIINFIDDFNIENLPKPCIIKPKLLWSGKQIFSLILPKKLNFSRFREETPEKLSNKLNILDNFVEIKNGELYQGIICKKSIGASCSGGITHCIWKMTKNDNEDEDGPKLSLKFLSLCQKIINQFLLLKGFSAGISDTICDSKTNEKIINIKKDVKQNIKNIIDNSKNGLLKCQIGKNMIDSFEFQSNSILNNACSEAGKIVKDSLSQDNNLKNMVSSGSKGNLTNISQITALVGQQNVEGKRISFDFKDRTLPHYLKFDYDIESKGFIENSFIKGLNPQEFFFHAKAGREGIIDTAIKTSESGYIQRRLIKSLEDIKVEYDGTVRNSKRNIIQFIYGEDGMAGEYIEDQKFETLNMDDETLEKKYKFSDDILENYIINNPQLNLNKDELKKLLNDEYKQIKKDRDDVRKNILKNGDNDIHIPVNIKRIINEEKINNTGERLNPKEILEKIKQLKNELQIIKGEDKFRKEAQDCALDLFSKVLNYSLSTKNMIINHKLKKDAFNNICIEIKKQFFKSIVNPGEMVGCLASQSIGEPATQMTLNTFHLAGVSSVNITLGIPRLLEIFNISKNIKTPSMSIYLNENNYNNEELLQLFEKIEYNSFSDIIESSEIYYDPDINNSIIEDDLDMINEYIDIRKEEINRLKDDISPWVLRIIFKEEKMINNRIGKMKKIEKKIEEIITNKTNYNCLIIYLGYKMQIRLVAKKDKNKMKINVEDNSLEILRSLQLELLPNSRFSGIEQIKKIYHKKIKKIEYNQNNGKIIEPSTEEYLLETEGSNLSKIFEIGQIDFKRTKSNDINDIYKVLGIEAARNILIEEIKKVFDAYGIYINYRHISVLCDYITQKGILTPISRHGLKKAGFGPIRRATNEEAAQNLLEAAIFSEKDQLKGVSEQILVGLLPKIGTNSFDLLYEVNN